MALLDDLKKNREKILKVAAECGLENIRVFGSVARRDERPDSDIDFLVSVTEGNNKGWDTFGFPIELEKIFGRKVDMVFESGLYHVIRERVLNEAVAL